MTSEIWSCTNDVKSLNILHTQVQGFLSCHSSAGHIPLADNFCKNDCLLYFSIQTFKKPQHTAVTGNYCHRAHQKPPKLTMVSSTIISANSGAPEDFCHRSSEQMYQEDQSDNFCHLGWVESCSRLRLNSCHRLPKQMYQVHQSDNSYHLGSNSKIPVHEPGPINWDLAFYHPHPLDPYYLYLYN
jgi:hypothetical protein